MAPSITSFAPDVADALVRCAVLGAVDIDGCRLLGLADFLVRFQG
jgi:hypothetical protein